MQPIPLFDIRQQNVAVAGGLRAAFERVLEAGDFILGREVTEFERLCCDLLDVRHAIGVSSGTDALYLALAALGIGPGHEVITTAFTFVATAEAIVRTGATPVFADVDPDSLCLCPASTERLITSRTRAVLYVHLYGNTGTIAEHAELCRRKGISLVEDACQAFGARSGARAAGTWGQVGCFSFFPSKPLGGLGDGGLCATDDMDVARQVYSLRSHGIAGDYYTRSGGGNCRLDALHAALLAAKLSHVEAWRVEREIIAQQYCEAFRDCRSVSPPAIARPGSSAWALYTLRIPEGRARLKDHLRERGIESRIYYPRLLVDHPAVFPHRCPEPLMNASRACREVLSVPIYSGLAAEARQRIIDGVIAWENAR